MNTAKIEFQGTISDLIALLDQHKITGEFSAKIRVEIGLPTKITMIQELNACESGIQAIKLYRDKTEASFKEAKDFVVANCRDRFPNMY